MRCRVAAWPLHAARGCPRPRCGDWRRSDKDRRRINCRIVAFRSAKGRSFAERKTTLIDVPILSRLHVRVLSTDGLWHTDIRPIRQIAQQLATARITAFITQIQSLHFCIHPTVCHRAILGQNYDPPQTSHRGRPPAVSPRPKTSSRCVEQRGLSPWADLGLPLWGEMRPQQTDRVRKQLPGFTTSSAACGPLPSPPLP